MGYACPVCSDPQADAEHLANHLAFTAMLRDDDHEAWLDDRVPDWAEMSPDELAERVVDHADETEYPQVFEDTTGSGRGEDHDHGGQQRSAEGHGHGGQGHGTDPTDDPAVSGHDYESMDLDASERAAAEDVLAEAREMTRQRRENAVGEADSDDSDEAADDENSAE